MKSNSTTNPLERKNGASSFYDTLRIVTIWITRVWALIIVLLLVILPLAFFEGVPKICTYRLFTGRDCPGCGMTRACCLFFHGRFSEAMIFNRAVVVVAPFLIAIALYQAYRLIRMAKEFKRRDPR